VKRAMERRQSVAGNYFEEGSRETREDVKRARLLQEGDRERVQTRERALILKSIRILKGNKNVRSEPGSSGQTRRPYNPVPQINKEEREINMGNGFFENRWEKRNKNRGKERLNDEAIISFSYQTEGLGKTKENKLLISKLGERARGKEETELAFEKVQFLRPTNSRGEGRGDGGRLQYARRNSFQKGLEFAWGPTGDRRHQEI